MLQKHADADHIAAATKLVGHGAVKIVAEETAAAAAAVAAEEGAETAGGSMFTAASVNAVMLPASLSAAGGEIVAGKLAPKAYKQRTKFGGAVAGGAAGGAAAGGLCSAGLGAAPGAAVGAIVGAGTWTVGQVIDAGKTLYFDERDDFGVGLGACNTCKLPVWNRGCKRCNLSFCPEDFEEHSLKCHPHDHCNECPEPW